MMLGSSEVPSTAGWLARICSMSVDPARGMPTMKIGAVETWPDDARRSKNSRVKRSFSRRMRAVLSARSNGSLSRCSALPRS